MITFKIIANLKNYIKSTHGIGDRSRYIVEERLIEKS